jgi:bifunctional UDP-N-acetylglucosamine pyrophosphorylase/glucosamine-1-phosphate N-acetyltransferase
VTFLTTEDEADRLPPPSVPFTAIVPAAGLGTRLGHDQPKILFPVLGRPIMATLLELLSRRAERIVLVVSPSGRASIERALAEHFPNAPVVLAEQKEPRGMGDAVAAAEPFVPHAKHPHCVVVWGDQVTLRDKTLDRLQRVHASRKNATLTAATIERDAPYIHFERDAEGRIVKVHEARKAPIPVPRGENDCGLFAFGTARLFEVLREADARAPGQQLDLLPLFPEFERGPGTVGTLRLTDDSETLGVNTQADAKRVEEILLARAAMEK